MRIGMGQIAPIFPGGDTDLSTGVTVSGYTVGNAFGCSGGIGRGSIQRGYPGCPFGPASNGRAG